MTWSIDREYCTQDSSNMHKKSFWTVIQTDHTQAGREMHTKFHHQVHGTTPSNAGVETRCVQISDSQLGEPWLRSRLQKNQSASSWLQRRQSQIARDVDLCRWPCWNLRRRAWLRIPNDTSHYAYQIYGEFVCSRTDSVGDWCFRLSQASIVETRFTADLVSIDSPSDEILFGWSVCGWTETSLFWKLFFCFPMSVCIIIIVVYLFFKWIYYLEFIFICAFNL